MVNYNAGVHLAPCVRSALGAGATKVVVVDNRSTDGSLDTIGGMGDVGEVLVYRSEVNRGFAAACNVGTQECESEYILFLNPDCILDPDSLTHMVLALANDNEAGAAGGYLCNSDGSEQPGGRRVFPTPRRAFIRAFGLSGKGKQGRFFSDFLLHREPLPSGPVAVEAISGACFLVKRRALTDVGNWDEGYFLHCEDLDLCMRFRERKWKVLFVPNARVTHAWGVCGRTRPLFVEWHKHRGMIRFYRKFFRTQYPAILWPMVVLGVWIRFVFAGAIAIVAWGKSKVHNR